MKKNIAERLTHTLTAMLLTAGILMPLLGVMDRSFMNPRLLIVSAAIVVLFEAVTLHRISSLITAGAAVTGILIWGLSPGGSRILSDLTIAVSLRIRGTETALPLVADSAMIVTTCLITVLCCLSCVRKVSFFPTLLLCLGVSAAVWLAGRQDLIPWLLPALAALLTKVMTAGFTETRAVRILPWAGAVILLAFLAAGNGATVPALKDRADELRRSVTDRLFFTETRDVFSLYSVGLSPQGPEQLGGKPDPTDDPVMMVNTPKTAYLRGAVYDEYTGHGWLNTAGGKRYLWQSDRMEADRTALFDQNLPSEAIANTMSSEFTVSIRMLCDSTSTLFVPQRIRELVPGANMVPYFSGSSEVFITRNLQAGDTYSVRATLYHSGQADIGSLVEICGSGAADPVYDSMSAIYFQIPDHMESSVYELARRITRDAGSDYRKAAAIRDYLLSEYEYTMDVEPHPENRDFVTEFLLNTKKGYCTYFASAMTVLCRMNGLPARYVEGYLAEPDRNGEACVTGMDAHAWTEVYFKGFGWLTFDATPGIHHSGDRDPVPDEPDQSRPDPTPEPTPAPTPEPTPELTPAPSAEPSPSPENERQDPTPAPTPEPEKTPTTPESSDTPGAPSDSPEKPSGSGADASPPPEGFPWLLIPAILLLLLILRLVLTSPAVRAARAHTGAQKAAVWIQEISDLLTAENIRRKSGETMLGFAERVDRTGYFTTVIRPVGEVISLMVYSRKEADEDSITLIRDTAVTLRPEISRPAGFRYWVRRIFQPVRRRDWRNR